MSVPFGVKPDSARRRNATAIVRGDVQHVDRAAAPHEPVDDLAAERVAAPPVGVDGHDVGVAHEEQAGRVGVAPLDAADEALAARLRLVALDVEAGPSR